MNNIEREFIGLFMADGCISIIKCKNLHKNKPRVGYAPIMKIELRADNIFLLHWIKKHFGGYVFYRTKYKKPRKIVNPNGSVYTQNPTAGWKTGSRKNCLKIVSILEKAKMPAKKKDEIPLFKKFLEMKKRGKRHGFGGIWFTDKEIEAMNKVRKKLSSIKKYSL